MGIAMICDICRRPYDIIRDENTCIKVLRGTGNEYQNMMVTKSYDICPGCLKRLGDVANKLNLEVTEQ